MTKRGMDVWIVLALLLFFHGLIHSMGFIKSFHLAQINELKTVISKPIGIIWLAISWLLEEGKFTWFRLEIEDYQYNRWQRDR